MDTLLPESVLEDFCGFGAAETATWACDTHPM